MGCWVGTLGVYPRGGTRGAGANLPLGVLGRRSFEVTEVPSLDCLVKYRAASSLFLNFSRAYLHVGSLHVGSVASWEL